MTVLSCPICDRPLDDGEPWQLDLDGDGAHLKCLEILEPTEEEEHDDR